MADNSILTPGYLEPIETPPTSQENELYLLKDNYLSEYTLEEEKAIVRENLNVPSKDSVYTTLLVDTLVSEKIRDAIQLYLNMEDPHGILPLVELMLQYMAKTDGSTPFIMPLKGVFPQKEDHLTTKKYVDDLLKNHISSDDPHEILPIIEDLLSLYVKTKDIYSKTLLYTKNDIDRLFKDYIRNDGTTPFTKALIGADPQIDSHLSTKRYVDKALYSHIVDIDPHGFISILNDRLAAYIKKKDVFDKTQTYSRTQIESLIHKAVNDTIDIALLDYMSNVDNKFEDIRLEKYIKSDGSVPFTNPLSGVDAVEDSDLTTLKLLNQSISDLKEYLVDKIDTKEYTWVTSGPAESNVGNITIDTDLPATMSMQEVLDAIFYGRGISLNVPKYINITDNCLLLLCIHGSVGLIEYAELYKDGTLIASFTKNDFAEDRCIIFNAGLIFQDTDYTFKVVYLNGTIHEETKTVICSLPIFIGLLPKYKSANTIDYEYLQERANEDSLNNIFYHKGGEEITIDHHYEFTDKALMHLIAVVPNEYPDLLQMKINSLLFNKEAFEVIDMIPLHIPDLEEDIIYKIYVYKLALYTANLDTTFKFKRQ